MVDVPRMSDVLAEGPSLLDQLIRQSLRSQAPLPTDRWPRMAALMGLDLAQVVAEDHAAALTANTEREVL